MERYNARTVDERNRSQDHWPDGLVDKLLEAVDVRNYLAHHYLREYFVVVPAAANRDRAAQELADLSVWVEDLIGELDEHVRLLGIDVGEELDEQLAREVDAPTGSLAGNA